MKKAKPKPPPRAARYDYTKRVDPVDDTHEEEMLDIGATNKETVELVVSGRVKATTWGML